MPRLSAEVVLHLESEWDQREATQLDFELAGRARALDGYYLRDPAWLSCRRPIAGSSMRAKASLVQRDTHSLRGEAT